jgi:hypothetical protein
MGALRDPASNWRACFPLLRQILRSFERHGREAGFEGTPMFQSFTMLPLCTPRAKYIQLDWSSLKEVCQRLEIWEEPPAGGSPFDSYFDLSLVRVSPENQGGVIKVIRNVKTDGVGVSVTVERVGLRGQKRGPTLFGARDDQPPAVPKMAVPGCRIVGTDPGKRYLFYAAHQDGGAQGVKDPRGTRCSARGYREMAGIAGFARKQAKWMAGNPVIRDWAEEAPRREHAIVDGFSERLDAELAKMDTLLSFYSAKRWAKQHWACWMGKQRAMNVLVNRIRGNAPAMVVAFGDGRFNPHIRGRPPAAVMRLRRALARASCRVFEVNEHMTSQVMVNCLSVFSRVFKLSL